MNNPCFVAVTNAFQDLLDERLNNIGWEWFRNLFQQLWEVNVAELLHEPDVGVCHDDIFEFDDIGVVKLMKNWDFAQSGRRDPIIKILNFCTFQSHCLLCVLKVAFVDVPISSLADWVLHDVVFGLEVILGHLQILLVVHIFASK